ncbi:MAG: type IX secretion system membrane protein PorP/SprF [Cyclobacteriaceae bacterium]|nr:type IX secretion system membrane protein PorP/SprF [Cyclobacteriaceae bacterium]
MKKPFGILLILNLFSFQSFAQTDPKLSVFSFNPLFYNPAFAGSGGGLSVIGIHSSQFVGFEGAPHTQYLSTHGLWEESNLGMGLDIYNDSFGSVKETGINTNFSYFLRLSEKLRMSFGGKFGITKVRVDYSQLNIQDPDEDIIQDGQFNLIQPNIGFGTYLYTDNFYFGISSPSIFSRDRYDPFESEIGTRNANFYLMSGMVIPLDRNVTLMPNVLIRRIKGAPMSTLVSMTADFYENVFFGVNWEYRSSAGLLAGFRFAEQFKTGYAFDFPTHSLGRYTQGTHTLFLSYNLSRFKRASNLPCFFY